MMSNHPFPHYHDFRQRATSQLFGISKRLKPHTMDEWIAEIEKPESIENFFLYCEEGISSETFADKIKDVFPEVEIHIIDNIPEVEIDKIIKFCDNYNDQSRIIATKSEKPKIWPMPAWCFYDVPNERIIYCDDEDMPTDEEIKNNWIKMPTGQAARIRKVKGLPMPSPPPPGGVVVRE